MAATLPLTLPRERRTFGLLPMLVAAALVYSAFWPIMVPDIVLSYTPWLEHIAREGVPKALGTPFGDYTPPYYYMLALASPFIAHVNPDHLVKIVSLLGTLLLAGAVLRLAHALKLQRPEIVAAATLLLPGVALNTALMGQCDAMSTAPLVMAVAAVVERRSARMFLWCGVAVAVKAQAVFCAPFFLAMAFNLRAPVREWLIAPAATLAMFAPAMLLGWPLADLLTIYIRQAGFFEQMSMNAPNIWSIVQAFPATLPLTTVANIAASVATIGYVVHFARRSSDRRTLVAVAALAPLIVVGLLPRMHERYFYAADVLVFVWAAASGRRADWMTAGLVQLGSLLGILAYGTGLEQLAIYGAVATLTATWRLAKPLIRQPVSGDEPICVPSPA